MSSGDVCTELISGGYRFNEELSPSDPGRNEEPGPIDPRNDEEPGPSDPRNDEVPGPSDPWSDEEPGPSGSRNDEERGPGDPGNDDEPCPRDLWDDEEQGANDQGKLGLRPNRAVIRSARIPPKKSLPKPGKFYGKKYPPMSYEKMMDMLGQVKNLVRETPKGENETNAEYNAEIFKDVEVGIVGRRKMYPGR